MIGPAEAVPEDLPSDRRDGAARRLGRWTAASWAVRSRTARQGITIVAIVLALGILIPWLSPQDPVRGSDNPALSPPSLEHPFGTDHLGRDVFVRTFAAVRIDLALAAVGVAVPMAVGTLIGSLIGSTKRRSVQTAGDVVIEGINAFPTLIVVIALLAALGTGAASILIALFLTAWARYAKVARARAQVVRDMAYVEVVRGLGFSPLRILVRHILPNVHGVAGAYAISHFVEVVLAIAALSFLGAGVQPPTPEWGVMMSDGRLYLAQAWWMVLFPGLLLSVTAIGVSMLASNATDSAFARVAK